MENSKHLERGIKKEEIDPAERRALENAEKLSARQIYEVVRRDGDEELNRPTSSLVWSGISAGIMISLSVLGEAILRTYLPDQPHSYLIENFGYTLGFLAVILGRMQLFTENTITTILPAMVDPSVSIVLRIARLWLVVLAANVVGAFAAAGLFAFTSAIPPDIVPAIEELSKHATGLPAGESFMRAIPAGVLIAAIVWMLPQAEESSFFVVLLFTWLIAVGDFCSYCCRFRRNGVPDLARGFDDF